MEYQKDIHGTQCKPSKLDLDFYKRQGTTQSPNGFDLKRTKNILNKNKEQ